MQPLDPQTRQRVNAALTRAELLGQDPAEYLHRYGLLSSPQLLHHTRSETAENIRQRLKQAGAPLPDTVWAMLDTWITEIREETWQS